MNILDLQLLRKNGQYWEANRDYLAMLKDMQCRGRLNGEQNQNYLIPSSADITTTLIIFLL